MCEPINEWDTSDVKVTSITLNIVICQRLLEEGTMRGDLWRRWHLSRKLNVKQASHAKDFGKCIQGRKNRKYKDLVALMNLGCTRETKKAIWLDTVECVGEGGGQLKMREEKWAGINFARPRRPRLGVWNFS